jgi:hypothetical protein
MWGSPGNLPQPVGFHRIDVLERRAGAYLQTSPTRFKCRNHVKPALAAINVSPIGYRDRGKLILYWPGWGDHG